MPTQQHRCKFCDAKIKRKRFENTNAYLGRDYCQKPKCMSRGREEQLALIYAKEKLDPSSRHAIAFMTRTLFIYRWGMEPMEAMDRYGAAASEDWLRIFEDVKQGRCMEVVITGEVCDAEGGAMSAKTQRARFHLPDTLTGDKSQAWAQEIAHAAHERMLEQLYGE